MPIFEYKGIDKYGKNVRSTIDADNSKTAKAKLKKDGIYVFELRDKTKIEKKPGQKRGSGRGVAVEDLSRMTRQLATMLKANVPLVESLAAVAEQTEQPTLKEAVADIKNMVNEGSPMHKALGKYPKIFKNIYISMCEAGEMSGTLDVILLRLAEFTESQNQLGNKVKSAMFYPVIMILFTLLILVVLFIVVIPQMITIFESSPGLELQWYTLAVIGFSGILVNYWYAILVGAIGAYLLFRGWKSTPSGSAAWDAIVLKLPVVGKLSRLIAVSRFTRTLSTLLAGGVPMLTAMDIVRNVVSNAVLAKAIDNARDNISEGESIAGPLKKSGQFPPFVISMINTGEKTGELETMLTQVSDAYDFDVRNSVDGLTSILAPVMIIVMGCVIGVIVFSIMLPMFEMSNLSGV